MTDLKNSIFGLLVESELFIEFTCAASVTHDLGFKVFFAQLQSAGNEKSHANVLSGKILRVLASSIKLLT